MAMNKLSYLAAFAALFAQWAWAQPVSDHAAARFLD